MSGAGKITLDQGVVDQLNVSRETIDQLTLYLALLEKWQPRINLVSSSTLADAWRRHVLDSAQLVSFLPENDVHILDIGSGAGFPGLVLSIITGNRLTLVESDQRKTVFLQTVIRELGLTASVKNARIEVIPTLGADIVTARALASVERLLKLLERQLRSVERCLFLKGASLQEELTVLQSYPTIEHCIYPSVTSEDGAVLELDTSRHPNTEL